MGSPGVILLDTRALIWWADGMGETLTPRARQPLDQERARVRRGEADAGLLVAAIPPGRILPLHQGVQGPAAALPIHQDPP